MAAKDYSTITSQHQEFLDERSEWESEWRGISDYLLPGRGIFQTYAKPRKRKLTSTKVVNPVAEDALNVLTSGMHGGLTSPSMEWFNLRWASEDNQKMEPLKMWLEECTQRLHNAFHASNFYSIINSFYTEYGGFGTGSIYVGEDTYREDIPFRFELLTAGEYSLSYGVDGRVDTYYRTIFMSPYQLFTKFPGGVGKDLKKRVEGNQAGIHKTDVTVLECVYKDRANPNQMDFSQVFYEITDHGQKYQGNDNREPLGIKGFHEMPYPTARWSTIGADVYGLGPGSRALPDIKRLQEMERAFLMATHKAINPPLNAPARMRGKLNTLPGGYNYYSNPNEKVEQIYQVNFDYSGVGMAVERVEQRIQRNFFNDIFLTAARDPNASPLRTGQVQAQEQEKMLRLGPVIERLQHEFFQPIIERCFNIMGRKGLLPELPPELAEMAGEYEIHLVSPLAAAQKRVAVQGIQSFLGFVGQASQFDQRVLDNVDIDKATREVATVSGVNLGILRPMEDVERMRTERAKAEAQARAKEEAAQDGMIRTQLDEGQANAALTQAQAGEVLANTQQTLNESGSI